MEAEFKAYQDALANLKTATENVNRCRIILKTAVDEKAEEFGAQVASDTKAADVKPA